MITFTCDLAIPRTAEDVWIPTAWARDSTISFEARGFIAELLSYAEPGLVVNEATLPFRHHPDNPPLSEVVAELVAAGYLVRELGDRYRLVHPDRLPPL